MKSWTPEDLRRACQRTRELLTELEGAMDKIAGRVAADSHGGLGSGGGDGRSSRFDSQNNTLNPKLAEKVTRDPVRLDSDRLAQGVFEALGASWKALGAAKSLLAVEMADARYLASERRVGAGRGGCVNCGDWCEGTRSDRLKAGRCPKCWEWRRRHGGEERPKDEEEAA